MIKLPALILLSVLMISCTNHKYQNSLQKDGIKGNVKSISIIIKQVNQYGDSARQVCDYDLNGNLLEENIYSCINCEPKDEPALRTICKFDEHNRITEYATYGLGKFKQSRVFKYSIFTNQAELYDSFPNTQPRCVTRIMNKYDALGNEIERKEIKVKNAFNPKDELIRTTTFKYDNKGNKIETNVFSGEGKLLYKTDAGYDINGNCKELVTYQPEYKRTTKTTYKYGGFDKDGNWLKQELYVNDTLFTFEVRSFVYYF